MNFCCLNLLLEISMIQSQKTGNPGLVHKLVKLNHNLILNDAFDINQLSEEVIIKIIENQNLDQTLRIFRSYGSITLEMILLFQKSVLKLNANNELGDQIFQCCCFIGQKIKLVQFQKHIQSIFINNQFCPNKHLFIK